MKTIVALIAIALACSGCSDARGRASVMLRFPGADVAMVPDESGKWIIRQPDGSIWYAKSEGIQSKPSIEQVVDIVELLPKQQ